MIIIYVSLSKKKKDILAFMEIFCLFKQMNYDQAVEYMKKNFGEVSDTKTIYFGSKCSLEITLDPKLRVYHFDFKGDDLDYDLLEKYLPDWEEKISKSAKESLQQMLPENSSNNDALGTFENNIYNRRNITGY